MVTMKQRMLLVNLFAPSISAEEARLDAEEMYHLLSSLGEGEVIDMVHQRGYPAKEAYIGTGKAQQVADLVKELNIDVVVLNGMAKSRQIYTLQRYLAEQQPRIQVWDRIDLILRIFSTHAHTAEAKLQIELAQMRHMGFRMYGMGQVLSQQGGGIGTRGIGETNVELMKRHWKDAIRLKRQELKKLSQQRERQIAHRKELGMPTVSIVGYTNAGKTTLFRRLAKKGVQGQDALFATLDSTVGKVFIADLQKEILMSDTIGFIKNLPPSLIEAFTSTLLESIHSDVLVHCLDASSATVFEQYHVVERILDELELSDKEEIIVVNKIDIATANQISAIKERFNVAQPVFVSSKTGEGFPQLLSEIARRLAGTKNPQTVSTNTIRIIADEPDDIRKLPRPSSRPTVPQTKRTARSRKENNVSDSTPHPNRDELEQGQQVQIVEKVNQHSGEVSVGILKRILGHGFTHPHGIKVELMDGRIGRVKKII